MNKNVQDKYGVFWYNQDAIIKWSQEDFDLKASEFAKVGVNIVMTFSCTHFRWSFYPWWNKINETIAKIVKACHKYDIKVVEHHSSHLTHNPRNNGEWKVFLDILRTRQSNLELFPNLKEYIACGDPEILPGVFLSSCRQIDGRTGDYARTVYAGYGHCFNNPNYRKVYFKYLEDVYKTGVDGIMTDDVQYFGAFNACACKYCREKFKEETNLELPQVSAWGQFHNNYQDKVFLEWLKFRIRSTASFQRDVNEHFKSLGLNLLRPNYATTTFKANEFAYPFEEAGKLWSCVFQENMLSSVIRTAFLSWHNIAEHRSSMAQKYNILPMSMFYPARYDDYYFCWSLAKAWNHLLMATPEGEDLNEVEQYFSTYDSNHPILENVDDISDVAFLESRLSFDFTEDTLPNVVWPFNVWLQASTLRNLKNHILFEDDSLEKFLQYKMIVLAGALMLTNEQLLKLKKYCLLGGRLLIAGLFGIYDEDGSLRKHPENIFDIEVDVAPLQAISKGEFNFNGTKIPLEEVEESFSFSSIPKNVSIVAKSHNDIITGISAMDGKLIWLVGGVRCRKGENHHYDLRISRWLENPPQIKAQASAIDYLYQVPGAILTALLPNKAIIKSSTKDVLATTYTNSQCTQLHLVNIQNVIPNSFEIISHEDKFSNFLPNALAIDEDIILELTLPNRKLSNFTALGYSPEFNGAKAIPIIENNNTLKLKVPKGTFAGYITIKINHNNS